MYKRSKEGKRKVRLMFIFWHGLFQATIKIWTFTAEAITCLDLSALGYLRILALLFNRKEELGLVGYEHEKLTASAASYNPTIRAFMGHKSCCQVLDGRPKADVFH